MLLIYLTEKNPCTKNKERGVNKKYVLKITYSVDVLSSIEF
jgi:hypothetical protein